MTRSRASEWGIHAVLVGRVAETPWEIGGAPNSAARPRPRIKAPLSENEWTVFGCRCVCVHECGCFERWNKTCKVSQKRSWHTYAIIWKSRWCYFSHWAGLFAGAGHPAGVTFPAGRDSPLERDIPLVLHISLGGTPRWGRPSRWAIPLAGHPAAGHPADYSPLEGYPAGAISCWSFPFAISRRDNNVLAEPHKFEILRETQNKGEGLTKEYLEHRMSTSSPVLPQWAHSKLFHPLFKGFPFHYIFLLPHCRVRVHVVLFLPSGLPQGLPLKGSHGFSSILPGSHFPPPGSSSSFFTEEGPEKERSADLFLSFTWPSGQRPASQMFFKAFFTAHEKGGKFKNQNSKFYCTTVTYAIH